MPAGSDIDIALQPVIDVFSEMNIPYYVCGSLASSAYGVSRSTQDIDLVSDISRNAANDFYERLKDKYFLDLNMMLEAIDKKSSFNLIHLDTMLKIDVFILRDEHYHRSTFERITQDSIEQHENAINVFVASPEDVILSKLLWYKASNESSEKQWLDILGILKVQNKRLDIESLQYWAKELNVKDLLHKAFDESDIEV
jgi:hypothetical protein